MRIKPTDDEHASQPHSENATENQLPMETPPIWLSKRLQVSIVVFLCLVNSAMVTSNVNMAIVGMTSNESLTLGNVTITEPPEFAWDSTTEGTILSALSYGALLSFLGSVPVNIFGGSVSCALATLLMGITTLLQPLALSFDLYPFLICRFLTGLFVTFFNVSIAEIYSRWIPNKERSTLVSYSLTGLNVGYTISTPILGFLEHKWGWRMIFYFTGSTSVLLSILCFIWMKNQPSEDKRISREEQIYISKETSIRTRKNVAHPYKEIILSMPIWALLILQFAISWVPTLLNVYFPIYLKDLTQKQTDEIGILCSIPSAAQIIMFPVAGILIRYCSAHSNMTSTKIHKTLLSVALLTSSALFVEIAFIRNLAVCLVIFVLIQVFASPVHLFVQLIVVDIAPNDTSVIAGLATFSQAVSCLFSRLITGFMITNHSLQEWNNCFFLMALVLYLSWLVFLVFGSSEAQKWSLQHDEDDDHSSNIH